MKSQSRATFYSFSFHFHSFFTCTVYVYFLFCSCVFPITRFIRSESIDHIFFSLVRPIWAQDACVKVRRTFHL